MFAFSPPLQRVIDTFDILPLHITALPHRLIAEIEFAVCNFIRLVIGSLSNPDTHQLVLIPDQEVAIGKRNRCPVLTRFKQHSRGYRLEF